MVTMTSQLAQSPAEPSYSTVRARRSSTFKLSWMMSPPNSIADILSSVTLYSGSVQKEVSPGRTSTISRLVLVKIGLMLRIEIVCSTSENVSSVPKSLIVTVTSQSMHSPAEPSYSTLRARMSSTFKLWCRMSPPNSILEILSAVTLYSGSVQKEISPGRTSTVSRSVLVKTGLISGGATIIWLTGLVSLICW